MHGTIDTIDKQWLSPNVSDSDSRINLLTEAKILAKKLADIGQHIEWHGGENNSADALFDVIGWINQDLEMELSADE